MNRAVRRVVWVGTMVLLGWSTARCGPPGTNSVPSTVDLKAKPAVGREKLVLPEPGKARLRPDRRVTYGGAVVKTVRSKNPLQMINPLAPARYGDGTENLAVDPVTGAARGVTLFSISFR